MIRLLKYKTTTFKAVHWFRSNYPVDTGALNLVLAFIKPVFALNSCGIVVWWYLVHVCVDVLLLYGCIWCMCLLICYCCTVVLGA